MDPKEIGNILTSGNKLFQKPQFLKKLTKFVVSVSVFSLFLSPKFYISRFTLQLLTHTIDKNYMFLFCNGLLVIVAKFSSLITSASSSSSSKPSDQSDNNKTVDYGYFENYRAISEFESLSKQYQQEPFIEEVMKTVDDSSLDVGLVEEPTKDIYMVQEYQEMQREEEEPERHIEEQEEFEKEAYEEEDEDVLLPHEQENDHGDEFEETNEVEDDEEEIGAMTAEELNKKFDEFIRKMKEELRIEARRQLIVV